jgi:XrtN system VIT domain protein
MLHPAHIPPVFLETIETTEAPTERYQPHKDNIYLMGLGLLLLSVLFFLALSSSQGGFSGLLNYMIVWVYTIALWGERRIRWWMFGARRENFPVMLLLLLLWMVSCFALNRDIRVFQPSVPWLSVHLTVSAGACIAYAWRDYLPEWGKMLLYASLGATAVLFGYYSLALMPLPFQGLLLFWFFGLTLHLLIPIVFTIYIGVILSEAFASTRLRWAAMAGFAFPVAAAVLFIWPWYRLNGIMADASQQWEVQKNPELPRWVAVGQRLPAGMLN